MSSQPARSTWADGAKAPTAVPDDPMLATRLVIPERRAFEVDRERIFDLLSRSVEKPLMVVSAPAGSGKTCAVASWARAGRAPGRMGWLTIDEEDSAQGVFWAYMIESLRRAGVSVDEELRRPPRPVDVPRAFLARLAASLAVLDQPVVLALDQIDMGATAAVAPGLDFVVRNAAPNLRLVVTTRGDPVLPLHRYRLDGELAEIGPDELAFTRHEAEALLKAHLPDRPGLAAEVVAPLLDRTRGWAGGLRLYGVALQRTEDPARFAREPETGDELIDDYLFAEVLDPLPTQTRDLLLRVSLLGCVCPDLADRLTGRDDAAQVLGELARSNAFVERVDIGKAWYRLHPTFGQALRRRLRADHPHLEGELHARAAHWFAEAGRLLASVNHAAAAHDWELAAEQVIEQYALPRLLGGMDRHRLDQLLAGVPRPPTSAATALVLAARGTRDRDPTECLAWLDMAEELTASLPPERQPPYQLDVGLLRVVVARVLGDVEVARASATAAERALERMPAQRLATSPETPLLILTSLGAVEMWAGNFDEAAETLTRAVEASGADDAEHTRHRPVGQLALLELQRGHLGQADAYAAAARELATRSGLPLASHSGAAWTASAKVALERNELGVIDEYVNNASAAGGPTDPLVVVELAVVRARIHLLRREFGEALDVIGRAARLARERHAPRWLVSRLAAEKVRVHLARGDLAAAEDSLKRMDPGPEATLAFASVHLRAGRPGVAVQLVNGLGPAATHVASEISVRANLIRALAAFAMKDEQGGRRGLAHAVELANREGYRWPFLEVGGWIRQIISRFPDLAPLQRWLAGGPLSVERQASRPAPATPDSNAPAVVVESLSQRERDVLGLLAQGYSTPEISEELFVSVNTVKTHLKAVYRKLAASRRREAVRRARELNLV